MQINYSLEELHSIIQPLNIEGSTRNQTITGLASLDKARVGDLAFLSVGKYKSLVPETKASVVLLPTDYQGSPKENQAFFRVQDPSQAITKLCLSIEQHFWPKPLPSIHPSAIIHPKAEIDPQAFIGPLCIISEGAKIAKNTILEANVYIGKNVIIDEASILMPQSRILDYCIVGKRARIHSGVVIGSDGFGYQFEMGLHKKIPQIGIVVIEDDVEIGSNTTIDRARFSETRIGTGTKIDNLVQIAHNVQIGKHCLIVSQAGIAGSTVIEDYVVIGGQVGIVDHVTIGRGVKIGSQSGINENVEAGAIIRGSPSYPYMMAQRLEIFKKRLPELFNRVSKIEETLKSHKV